MRDESSGGEHRLDSLSRRQILALAGAGIPVGLAGCSGGGDGTTASGGDGGDGGDGGNGGSGDGSSGDTDTDRQPKKTRLNFYPVIVSGQDVNFNKASSKSNFKLNQILHQMFGQPMIDGDMSTPWFSDYAIGKNNKSMTVTVNEKGTWTNGDDVTGEDLHFLMEFGRRRAPESSQLKSVERIGDYKVKWETKQQYKDVTLVKNWNVGLNQGCHMHPGSYMDWFEKFGAASTSEKRKQISKKLENTSMSHEDVEFSGPFQIEEFRTDEAILSVRDNYYKADTLGFLDEAYVKFIGGESVRSQLVTNGDVDVGWGSPLNKSLKNAVPKGFENVDTWGNGRAFQFVFNFNNKHLGKRKFRQALAHLLDIEQIVTNVKASGSYGQKTPGRQSGLMSWQTDKWLGDLGSKLYDYGQTSKAKKAAQLLRDIDYSKQNGQWVDPDGKPVKLKFRGPTWSEYANAARTFNSQLNDFGIKTDLLITGSGTYYPKVMDEHDFDLMVAFYGGGKANTHPVTNYSPEHELGFYLGGGPSKALKLNSEGKKVPGVAKPFELTIPKKPGSLEVSGDGQQINLAELVSELNKPIPKKREKEIVAVLARYFNYEVAQVLHFDEVGGVWANHADFKWPGKGEYADKVQTKRPGPFMVRNGFMGPKYE